MTEREAFQAVTAWAEAFAQSKVARGAPVPAQLREAIAAAEEWLIQPPHVCGLPASIVEALNSGDGVYRP